MLRLSKKVEYGIIAIRHIASRNMHGTVTTAKEISDTYDISYELLAKVLQKLAKKGLISSYQGVHGGYTLARNANTISISSIINAIEGYSPAITQCISDNSEKCEIFDSCTIKNPLGKIQTNINDAFEKMMLSEIV
jgi:Rrf2 family transcriptional regulator, nitric oxide-sensitive transcriptional repressor